MADFTLDTSGAVANPISAGGLQSYRWSDLYPFTQGYTEAAARAFWLWLLCGSGGHSEAHAAEIVAFRNWAPETLAAILRDCAAAQEAGWRSVSGDDAFSLGKAFWTTRQLSRADAFPPLTPYLGDDGKVYLRP